MAKKQLGPTTNLFPMPAVLLAVKTGEDSVNILTVAWCGIVGGNPPLMALEIGANHFSTPFIEREGCFTVNVPSSGQAVGADYCGLVSGTTDPNKPATCGWTMAPATQISAPLIAECPLNLECRIVKKVDTGSGMFYLAEILETHVEEAALVGSKKINASALDPLIFTPDGFYHKLGARVAKAWDAGKTLKKAQEIYGKGQPMNSKEWFRQAKFGMMVHWGLYSLPAGEWNGQRMPLIGEWAQSYFRIPNQEYGRLAGIFNPILFDAEEWVRLALEAGMQYLVVTSKHHDGFAMFRSAVDPYNIHDASPFRRDVIGELADACHKHGLKLGLYYSQDLDWHEPNGGGYKHGHTNCGVMSWTNDWDYPDNAGKNYTQCFERKIKPQVEEILRNYGDLCLIWFDTPLTISPGQSTELYHLVKKYQPDCLINSRIGNGMGDYRSWGDNQIPDEFMKDGLFETPATLNDTWGYKSFDQNWKSAEEIIRLKNHLNARGINYLLNVGPDYLGRIPAPCQQILREVGREPGK